MKKPNKRRPDRTFYKRAGVVWRTRIARYVKTRGNVSIKYVRGS